MIPLLPSTGLPHPLPMELSRSTLSALLQREVIRPSTIQCLWKLHYLSIISVSKPFLKLHLYIYLLPCILMYVFAHAAPYISYNVSVTPVNGAGRGETSAIVTAEAGK